MNTCSTCLYYEADEYDTYCRCSLHNEKIDPDMYCTDYEPYNQCGYCDGEGFIGVMHTECPKCKGFGIIEED